MGWHDLLAHALSTHDGVVGRRCCAERAALTSRTFEGRARREHWHPVHPGVFLLPGHLLTNTRRTIGAALCAGPNATVAGASALGLHGSLPSVPARVELLVPPTSQRIVLPQVRTRWTQACPEHTRVERFGVPTTSIARSLADIAGEVGLVRLRAIAFDAIGNQALTLDDLRSELERRQRFPGRRHYRHLLDELAGDGSESGFEFEVRSALRTLGLTPDRDQAVVETRRGRRRIDIAFSDAGVGIECLGFRYHSSAAALERDALRSNAIASLDHWLILQLTMRMFHLGWPAFVRDLRGALATRAGRIS